ncbi:V-type ATP synthase subunit D [Gemmatimonadota bacterium]
MAKVRLTKNELKKQKDNLKRFTRYLPTLELKKKQLLLEIRRIQQEVEALDAASKRLEQEVSVWAGVFADQFDLHEYIKIEDVLRGRGNIAGIDIPTFDKVIFEDIEWDYFEVPFWVDRGIVSIKEQISRRIEQDILREQEEIVRDELRITIQRIKLFEEVKIPESKEAIRIIQIFLGDGQTAEVVRGKIAKNKIAKKRALEASR